ncbi:MULTISPECIES: glycosyltransferase [Proteus]|uniref:glycosyltransferase n=1 Tax=Proteus TaxID=583 RepID=UPI000D6DCB89|nr:MULTISPECIES: glycosyltransferase [Proteus]MBG2837010.1 glycosyltransferase [Proteus terrae subsp. cibarius]MBG2868665.1 glycosyltransferase [Proteus terrae subsp. cibarius]MBJ2109845.1 glycosyltransferase [Proteus terrae]MBJ2133722.1 glycosyltransferase [Proteus terrae]
MNIAFVVTSLSNKGPIIVVKDIIEHLPIDWDITIYFFDEIIEINFPKRVQLIKITNFYSKVDLSKHDIIHSHLLRPDIFCLINRKTINKHVSTMHADIIRDLQISHGFLLGGIVGLIWSSILKYSDHVVFLTDLQKKKYSHIKKRSTIYNGRPIIKSDINVDDYLSNIKSKNSNYILLGACANIVKRKGFDQIMTLMSRDDGQQYLFTLVGNGPELDKLKQYAIDLGIQSRCIFIDKSLNVQKYLMLFDIFIMTSHSEGMPLALLEAAACGLPIVCTSLPVIQEIFTSDEVSFYECNNIDSLSKSINYAVNNSLSLSTNVKRKFLKEYTDKNMSQKYQNLYISLFRDN